MLVWDFLAKPSQDFLRGQEEGYSFSKLSLEQSKQPAGLGWATNLTEAEPGHGGSAEGPPP